MKSYFKLGLGATFAICLLGCNQRNAVLPPVEVKSLDAIQNDERDLLIGSYGLLTDGKIVPFIRVIRPSYSQKFVMQEWGRGDWQGAMTMGNPLNLEESKKLAAGGLPNSAITMRFGNLILVKVSKADAGTLSGTTGFALLSEIGPIELTPMS